MEMARWLYQANEHWGKSNGKKEERGGWARRKAEKEAGGLLRKQ